MCIFLEDDRAIQIIFVKNSPGLCYIYRSSHRRCSVRKGVLTNFAKFAGKHLCQSLFLNKVAGLGHVWATASISSLTANYLNQFSLQK